MKRDNPPQQLAAQSSQPAGSPKDQLADALAPIMFWLSLTSLALTAAVLVLWIDVPRVDEAYLLSGEPTISTANDLIVNPSDPFAVTALSWGVAAFGLLIGMWPIFTAEQLLYFVKTKRGESFHRQHRYWWAFCLCPPLRMCARHRGSRDRIWLPRLGWQVADYHLVRRLERAFSLPMIGIALLILPVLGLQTFYQDRIADYPALRAALHFGTGVIWFAFATEFIVMVSVTPHKFTYCRRHWLDLVIILLPLISFLRTLRILRAARLMNIAKLQQVSRLMRVYRLRGVAMRGWRALLLLDLAQRLFLSSPEKRIRKLEAQCTEKERELELLREQIESIRSQLATPKVQKTN
ncbi:MAG: potassium channel protein [Pirellulaceae bacterium]